MLLTIAMVAENISCIQIDAAFLEQAFYMVAQICKRNMKSFAKMQVANLA